MLRPPSARDWVAVGASPLPVDDAVSWATTPASGAVVTFTGVVRDHSEGRPGVVGITYEAFSEAAEVRLGEIAEVARQRWPALERVALLHRVGDLGVSEASVAVVASAPHRGEAFAAARFCIDTLKETVPIWKREHWAKGSDWAEADHPITAVGQVGSTPSGGPSLRSTRVEESR